MIDRTAMGDRLRSARSVAGLTLQQVADRAGVAMNTVWRWEDGSRGYVDHVEEVAKILDVEPSWLMFGKRRGRKAS
jgi:transcriptional regulator with XRE-family HTH domain